MVYKTFLNTVREKMAAALGKEYRLVLRQVPKNNGMVLDGLCITKGSSHVSSALYLNSCYRQYLSGVPLDEIVEDLLALYHTNQAPADLDPSLFSKYSNARSHLACRLVHAASNKNLLKTHPHVMWHDLAIVFYLHLREDTNGIMTSAIQLRHLKFWNLTVEELYREAMTNTPLLLPPSISSISSIMKEMGHTTPDPQPSAPFYVLTNTSCVNGAICMLYPDVLKQFSERVERDLIILPSSIHEVLLMPDEGKADYRELSRLVAFINETEVSSQDRLSDQIYLYSRETEQLLPAPSLS